MASPWVRETTGMEVTTADGEWQRPCRNNFKLPPLRVAQQVADLQSVGHQAGALLRRKAGLAVGQHLAVHDLDEPPAVFAEVLHQVGMKRLAEGGLVGSHQLAAAREVAGVLDFDAVVAEQGHDLVEEGPGGELEIGNAGGPVEQDHGGELRGVLTLAAAGRVGILEQQYVAVADPALHGVVGLLGVTLFE